MSFIWNSCGSVFFTFNGRIQIKAEVAPTAIREEGKKRAAESAKYEFWIILSRNYLSWNNPISNCLFLICPCILCDPNAANWRRTNSVLAHSTYYVPPHIRKRKLSMFAVCVLSSASVERCDSAAMESWSSSREVGRYILTIHTCVHSYVRLTSSTDRMPRKNRSIRMMWFCAVTHIHIDLSSNRLILVAENKCHKLCGHIELFLHIWQWLIIKRSCSRHHCRIHSTSNLKWWFGNPFRLIRSDSVYTHVLCPRWLHENEIAGVRRVSARVLCIQCSISPRDNYKLGGDRYIVSHAHY